ncbi:MAG TPA: ABC transporter substrate-binding protein [Nitriliruptorales bacterium]
MQPPPRIILRATALAATFALVLTACGQKEGVHDLSIAGGTTTDGTTTGPAATGETTGSDTTDTTGDDAGTDTTDTTGGDDTTGTTGGTTGTTGGGSTTGGTTTTGGSTTGDGSTTDGSGETTGASTGGPATPQGSDRTGVEEDAIHLAIHAPVTGAAPLPTTSFEQARDTYWRFLEGQGTKVLGRSKVLVEFKDDKYDPNSARQACRELEARAFIVVGGGGTDQIQACGQFAGVAQFPYFSAGVTEEGLTGNPWYFASSMTYRQQGPLLAQYVSKNLSGQKVAMIVTDTPNFDDAVAGWEQGVQQYGIDYFETMKHPKGDTSWYNSFAKRLYDNGVGVVYILSSPVDYIRFAQQAKQQGPGFQYVGVGITMGLNAVLGSGCDQVDGGIFFSPFPGLDVIDQLDPSFKQASQAQGAPADDIALALWGIARQEHELFLRYERAFGNDLTREDFRGMAEQSQGIETNVFPTVSYTPQDHFGADAVHVLQADCASGQHKTLATFKSSF